MTESTPYEPHRKNPPSLSGIQYIGTPRLRFAPHMIVTIQPPAPASGTTTLADAWASLSAAVPVSIHETTAQLQEALHTAAVATAQTSLAALTGPVGHVAAAAVAELACNAAEQALMSATDPLRDTSTMNSLRTVMRAEIHNTATGITVDGPNTPTDPIHFGKAEDRSPTTSQYASDRSPLSDAAFGPLSRKERDQVNKKRDSRERPQVSLLPQRLGLL